VKLLNIRGIILRIAAKFKKRRSDNFDRKMLTELIERISRLEKQQQELEKTISKKEPYVEYIIIERMHADKVEFNIDAIDVKELSGMLSIGLNYGGKLVRIHPGDTGNGKEDNKNVNSSHKSEDIQTPKPKINVFFSNSS